MTYLELVNNVLRRLREPEVTSVSDTEYSLMIGTMVNDAKREVENAHTWNALRTNIPVATTAGIQSYTLVGSGNRFVFDQCLDASNGWAIAKAPVAWVEQNTIITPDQGQPDYFCFTGDASGDTKVKFFKIPSGVFTYNFYLYIPQVDLSTNSTVVSVPDYLVAQNAYARAIAERGEDSGNLTSEAYAMYQKALADAVSIERNRYEEDISWEAK